MYVFNLFLNLLCPIASNSYAKPSFFSEIHQEFELFVRAFDIRLANDCGSQSLMDVWYTCDNCQNMCLNPEILAMVQNFLK